MDDKSLVPLVFVTHLIEELSSKSPFITDIGCDRSVVEGAPNSSSSERIPSIASRFPSEGF